MWADWEHDSGSARDGKPCIDDIVKVFSFITFPGIDVPFCIFIFYFFTFYCNIALINQLTFVLFSGIISFLYKITNICAQCLILYKAFYMHYLLDLHNNPTKQKA